VPTVQKPMSILLKVRFENSALGLKMNGVIDGRALARDEAADFMSKGVGSFHGMTPKAPWFMPIMLCTNHSFPVGSRGQYLTTRRLCY
jgi:hypothetical protein